MSTGEALLSIGELARRVGAAPSALRYWERAGLLAPSWEAGRRRYGPDAVRRVGVIRLCQDGGFGIAEIRRLLDDDPDGGPTWRLRLAAKVAELRAEAARLEAAADGLEHAVRCPEPMLAACPSFAAAVHQRAEGTEGAERPDGATALAGARD
jgi:DNA-binding transcriptional MerR regulator